MKNQTIYKDLKIKNKQLVFSGLVIHKFNDATVLDEHMISSTIFNLKRYLDNAMKTYLRQAYKWELVIDGYIAYLRLYCKEDDGFEYKKQIGFMSINKNQITYI